MLFSDKITPISPDWIMFEIGKNWKLISDKSDMSADELISALLLVRMQTITFPFNKYSDKIEEASKLAPHSKDAEYFALALKFDCPIWSDEKRFKKQSQVAVYNSSDMPKFIREI